MIGRDSKPRPAIWPVVLAVLAGAALLPGGAAAQASDLVPRNGRTGGPQLAAAATTIRLDAGTRYQTIDNWQVFPRYWEQDKRNNRYDRSVDRYAEIISRFLVNELGLNGARVAIWSGLENPVDHWTRFYDGRDSYREHSRRRYETINDNDDPFSVNPAGFQFAKFDHHIETMVLPLKRAVEANGERLYVNVNYVDFRRAAAEPPFLSHAKNPEEYAEFVLVFFERLRDRYGIVPDSLEIILEPDNTGDWRGKEIGRALVAAKRRLNAHGFFPEFIAPSTARLRKAVPYFDDMATVPGAVEALNTLSYHRYDAQLTTDLIAVRMRAEKHGLKTAMLEKIGAGIDVLLQDLTVARVSSWQQWAAATRAELGGGRGAYYALADIRDPGNPRISLARRSHHLAHVFKYVRGGAVRIGASSDNPDKRTVAFVNRDGSWTVVVRARRSGGALMVSGLPAGAYELIFTAENFENRERSQLSLASGRPLRTELPGPGVITIRSLNAKRAKP